MKLELRQVGCGYGDRPVLRRVSFAVTEGEILCLLGPNGVGKTTLFKTILGFLKLQEGTIELDGSDIRQWTRRQFARTIGYVPQAHLPPFPFLVRDVVLMGRTAHLNAFAGPSAADRIIVDQALEQLGIVHLRQRIYTELSGGERQMVLIARALAQQPKLLIMDEPTANLDFGNQIRLLEQINQLARSGLGVIMTTHFPDHAFLCGSQVVLMGPGGELKEGPAERIVTEANLKHAYGIAVKVAEYQDRQGRLVKTCIPLLN